jgi:hypothetical protein
VFNSDQNQGGATEDVKTKAEFLRLVAEHVKKRNWSQWVVVLFTTWGELINASE